MGTVRELSAFGESVCPYCGVGCRLRFEGRGGEVTRVRGVEGAAANLGGICAKSAQLGPTVRTPDRLAQPLVAATRHDPLTPTDWDAALTFVAERFRAILGRHGPGAVAFYGSGQLDTEAAYVAAKLFKGFLGCNNTDSNSRLCMAAAVAGYRTSLGSDAPPGCYEDIELADVILVIGSNMAEAHPVLFDRVRAAKKANPALRVIVADPRRTPTAAAADLHLPVAPGADIALLNALGGELIRLGAVDRAFVENHTRGFAEYRDFVLARDFAELCRAADLPEEDLRLAARWVAGAAGFVSFYCMGLNQSTVGVWKNNSVINLHLLTGQIGRPGAGPFSLTGQPNAMGGREAGLLAHQLPGYRLVDVPEHRREVEEFWGVEPGTMSPAPGLTAVEMFRALERGQLKAIWIAATNPAVSVPDLHQVRRALAKAELVVVQDAYHPTETTKLAHAVLPVAQWGEKDWTSTNSERTVTLSRKLWDPPGAALSDWQVLARFARRLGFVEAFDYPDGGAVWDEFIRLTKGRPCDMSGATRARLERETSLQWPVPDEGHPGTKRRYTDGVFPTPDGRAVFLPRDHREPCERTDHEFPLVLTTGRLYAHWHTLTRTGKVPKLNLREPEPFVAIHPGDAERLGVRDGEPVQVSSRRGTVRLPARLAPECRPGMVFVPFHWGDLFNEGNAANYLTISATGRVAKQPELKYCAVSVERVEEGSGGQVG